MQLSKLPMISGYVNFLVFKPNLSCTSAIPWCSWIDDLNMTTMQQITWWRRVDL